MKSQFSILVLSLFFFCSLTNAQWVQTGLTNVRVNTILVSSNNLFAGTNGGGIYLSTNNGNSWTAVNSGLTNTYVYALVVSPNGAGGTNLFAGTNYGGGVFLSTNNGTSWTAVNSGLTNLNVFAFAVTPNGSGGTNLFAGTFDNFANGAVFLSTNNGASWTETSLYLEIPSLAVSPSGAGGTNLFAGTSFSGVFLSTNNGTSWVQTGLTNTYVYALVVSPNGSGGTNLFAGTYNGGVFLSTNDGTSWTAVNSGLTSPDISSFASTPNGSGGTNLFAGATNDFFGTYYGGVFLSTNNGTSWTEVNSGLTNTDVLALAVSETNLFVGTLGGGVWRRPLSDMITGVEDQSNGIPTQFILEQNYPNPFNPSTTIRFQVPNSSFVNLKVYDVLGNEVATLVNEVKPAGSYEVKFNGSGLSSGIYFYKLQAGSFTETKKMILMK